MTIKLIELISIRKLGVVSYIVSKKVVDSLCLSQVTVYIYVVEFPPWPWDGAPFFNIFVTIENLFPNFLLCVFWPSTYSPMVHI